MDRHDRFCSLDLQNNPPCNVHSDFLQCRTDISRGQLDQTKEKEHGFHLAQQRDYKCYNTDICYNIVSQQQRHHLYLSNYCLFVCACVSQHPPHSSLYAHHPHRRARCSCMAHTGPCSVRPTLCRSQSCTSVMTQRDEQSTMGRLT